MILPKKWWLLSLETQLSRETAAAAAKSLQSCPTLCDPMDCGPPGSSIHGIFQAKVLEWGAFSTSKVSDGLFLPQLQGKKRTI